MLIRLHGASASTMTMQPVKHRMAKHPAFPKVEVLTKFLATSAMPRKPSPHRQSAIQQRSQRFRKKHSALVARAHTNGAAWKASWNVDSLHYTSSPTATLYPRSDAPCCLLGRLTTRSCNLCQTTAMSLPHTQTYHQTRRCAGIF